ncbi:MAG: cupin domain-containing protein [Sphaerochaetaceae bacterium]|nr:cupin domain-containing protein [Sphaerochaetaceae bacterium]
MNSINLKEKFNVITRYWDPKIIGELNGQYVKIAKLKGEFVWHHHDEEDELFMVIRGSLVIKTEHGGVKLEEGEMVIIPRGVEHMPVAEQEVEVLMFEPKGTINTGSLENEKTIHQVEKI